MALVTKKCHALTHNSRNMSKRRRTLGRRRPAFRRQARMPTVRPRRGRPTATGLGIELKFYDTSLVAAALTSSSDGTAGEQDPSATILLNTVVQGDGESNRDGRQIIMKSLDITGIIHVPAATNQTVTVNAANVMIAVVWDKQTNGVTIASENVYKNIGANAILCTSPYRNLQFVTRFRILKTLHFQLAQTEMAFDGTNIEFDGFHRQFTLHVDLPDIPVNYSAGTETVANITDNSLHLIAWANNVGQVPTISYNSRLRFVG